MTDSTQEPDPIINIMDMWDFSPLQDEDTRRERVYKEIQAHTNAEIARVLDRLEQSAVKYGGNNVMNVGVPNVAVPLSAIEIEHNKLKEAEL